MSAQEFRLMGNVRLFKVRLANLISENAAMLIQLVCRFRPRVHILAEQPKGSYMFKMPYWRELIECYMFGLVLTYMGMWGLDLLKATHLYTTLKWLGWDMACYGM